MATDILMPALSPTMEEGKLAKWLVKEGDSVQSGDAIAEIETDKATMEVEAVDEGTLAKILVEEGTEGVKVNTPIAVIAEEGEDVSAASVSTSPPRGDVEERSDAGEGASAKIESPSPSPQPSPSRGEVEVAAPAIIAAADPELPAEDRNSVV